MTAPVSLPLYFGKLPSRGDFVRSSTGSALIRSLDAWMSQTMDLLAQDTRWKLIYDAAAPVHFAIIGPHTRAGLVGHLAVSQDTSGRRFPFVLAAALDMPKPASLIPYCPQGLVPIWTRFDLGVREAMASMDFGAIQKDLVARSVEVGREWKALQDSYDQFAREQTLASVESMLSQPDRPFSFRQTALALGLLLQPVLQRGATNPDKGIWLPLPSEPAHMAHAITLWVGLVARFFTKTSAEIALFVTSHRGLPVLVMGFHGASAATLRSVLDADACATDNIAVGDADWVEDWIGTEVPLRRLSNLLRDPQLSVATAARMFFDTFLGE